MAAAWQFLQSKVLPVTFSTMVIDLYPCGQKLRDVHVKVVTSFMSLRKIKPAGVSNLSVSPKVIVAVKSFLPSDQVSVFNPTLYIFAHDIPAWFVDPPMVYIMGNVIVPWTENLLVTEGKSLQL